MPAFLPSDELEGTLYWVSTIGIVFGLNIDVAEGLTGSYRAMPEWFVQGKPSLKLHEPREASLGGQILGDGTQAWYWDVEDPEEPAAWSTFGIGCTAVWDGSRLLLLWGCTAVGNPVEELFRIAVSAYTHWCSAAASLPPNLEQLPVGMMLVEDTAIPKERFHVLGSNDTAASAGTGEGADPAAVGGNGPLVISGTGSTVTKDFPLEAGRYEVTVDLASECCISLYLYGPSDSEYLLFSEIFPGDAGGTATDIYQVPESGMYFIDSRGTDADWTVTFQPR